MKILAIVLTYYPERDLLIQNISAFIDHVDKVLIWENTPSSEIDDYKFIEHEKVEYYGDGLNSISHALNYAWKYAVSKGFDYLLTMDQDSIFKNFNFYLEKITLRYSQNTETFGIYTPQILGRKVERDIEKIDMPITSGMLLPVVLINQIGGWDEEFKIDSVDDEFSSHAHSLGIRTFVVKDAILVQRFGAPKVVKALGHTWRLRNYSASRLHDIFMNNTILIKRYPEATYLRDNFKRTWVKYIRYIFLEKNTFSKLKAIICGVLAGIKYNRNHPQ